MKRAIFIFYFLFFIFCESYSQAGWVSLNSGTTVNLSKIQFVNSQTGWAGGYQSFPTQYAFIKTTNAGATWFDQTVNFPTGNRILSLFFINANTGWVAGVEGLFKTTNGGANFSTASVNPCNDCYFTDALTGWIACIPSSPALMKTTNGGTSWDAQSVSIVQNEQLYNIRFLNSLTGYCSGNTSIIKTTNGGTNWITQPHPNCSNIHCLYAVSTDEVRVSGDSGIILTTSNGGANWISKNIGYNCAVRSLFFVNSLTGYAVTSAAPKILKTTNGGTNWYTQFTDTAYMFNGIYFNSSDTGYVCGVNGKIYKTTNGGTIGIKKINENVPEGFYLFQNYPNPFNPATKIKFSIPSLEGGQGGMTILKVYDILGKEVGALVNEKISPGTYEVTFNGSKLASGIYFYKLQSGNFIDKKKMILIK